MDVLLGLDPRARGERSEDGLVDAASGIGDHFLDVRGDGKLGLLGERHAAVVALKPFSVDEHAELSSKLRSWLCGDSSIWRKA